MIKDLAGSEGSETGVKLWNEYTHRIDTKTHATKQSTDGALSDLQGGLFHGRKNHEAGN
jgi:hypothetical protein